ncbi:MAG: lactonase family protein [Gemmatimonadetes bacterium]|nr:lactonase family protein [Gemmatimonadota bacterium]
MTDGTTISRRGFVGGAAVTALGAAIGPGRPLEAPGRDASAPPSRAVWELYVGTYTADTASRGIYRLLIDAQDGGAVALTLAAESVNPSFLALTPDRRHLVAVNEVTTYEGRASGGITAFTRDPVSGSLARTSATASLGGAPCYVMVDHAGGHLLLANYLGGNVAVFPLSADGTLGDATAMVQHRGRGPNAARQGSPHAHCVLLDRANRFAVVADLGIDRIKVYHYDAGRGTLEAAQQPEVELRAGAGPRHLVFAPDGRTVYVVNELDSTLVALEYDAAIGTLRERQVLSTRPPRATGDNYPADLHMHPTGRFVYASNRGDNTIAVFSINGASGAVTLEQSVPTGGAWPRNFALDPSGTLLLVANQRSDSIVAFRIDPATGRLMATGTRIDVPAPVCLRFVDPVSAAR